MIKLEELTQRSTIKFDIPLNDDQVEKFLNYLSKNSIELNYDISYKIVKSKCDSKNPIDSRYCQDISGSMSNFSKERPMGMGTFSCKIESKYEDNYFLGISFQTIPGYSLKEHRSEDIALWDKVRSLTQEYFSKYKE